MKVQAFSYSLTSNVFLFLIIFLFDSASAIRCYECSTSWNQDCSMSPPPARFLKHCSVPLCSKNYAEENGVIRVERFCGGSDFVTGCRDVTLPDREPNARYYRAISCRCDDQDACNGTTLLTASSVFISLLALCVCLAGKSLRTI